MDHQSGHLNSPGGAAKRPVRPNTLPTRPVVRDESDSLIGSSFANSDTSLAALRKTLEPVGRMFNPDDGSLKFSPLASPDLKKLAIPSPDIDKLIAAAAGPSLQTPAAVSLFLQSLTGVGASAGGAAHSPTTPILTLGSLTPFGMIGGVPVGVALTPTGSGSSSGSDSVPLPGPSTVPAGVSDIPQTLAVTATAASSLAPLMVPIGFDLGSMALLQQLGAARAALPCLSPVPLVTSAGAQQLLQQQQQSMTQVPVAVSGAAQMDTPKMEPEAGAGAAANEQPAGIGKRSRLGTHMQAQYPNPAPPPVAVAVALDTHSGVYQQQQQQQQRQPLSSAADSSASWARNVSSAPMYMQTGAAAPIAASCSGSATADGYSIASRTSSVNEHLEDGRSSRSTYVSSVSFSTSTAQPTNQNPNNEHLTMRRPAQSHSPLVATYSSASTGTVEGRPLASVQPFSIAAPSAPSSADSSTSSTTPVRARGQKRASNGSAKKSAGAAKLQEEAHVVPSESSKAGGSSNSKTRPIDMGQQETVKMERKRERNRIAARKCRERKISRIAELSATVESLEGDKEHLSTQITTLNDEIVRLRQIISEHEHSGCNVPLQAAALSALRGGGASESASARASLDHFSSTSNSPLVVHDATQYQTAHAHVAVAASPGPQPQPQGAVRLPASLHPSYVHNAPPPHHTSYS